MSKKERFFLVFKEGGIVLRYKLKDLENGEILALESRRGRNFAKAKNFFKNNMDDELNVTYKKRKYKLIYAEMLDEEIEITSDAFNQKNLVSSEKANNINVKDCL